MNKSCSYVNEPWVWIACSKYVPNESFCFCWDPYKHLVTFALVSLYVSCVYVVVGENVCTHVHAEDRSWWWASFCNGSPRLVLETGSLNESKLLDFVRWAKVHESTSGSRAVGSWQAWPALRVVPALSTPVPMLAQLKLYYLLSPHFNFFLFLYFWDYNSIIYSFPVLPLTHPMYPWKITVFQIHGLFL